MVVFRAGSNITDGSTKGGRVGVVLRVGGWGWTVVLIYGYKME